ncbi:hypothetical protein ACIP1T_24020 [Pseudomonas japonica]|uniref:hypothetical protein n=1 Tax=Pseudomonas japonica TaxID=256466 RepID=UPI0038089B02
MSTADTTSLPDLLRWLGEKPRTFGWNAILAYDSERTNTVLRQEYIERYDSGYFLKPLEELIRTTDASAEYVYDYVFDSPRLSFVNATIARSGAVLTQQVVGGAQLSLVRPLGLTHTRVEKVFSMDALDGPLLESEVALTASTGHVNLAGKVTLDISRGDNPRLLFIGSDEHQRTVGQHLQWRFALLPEDQRTIVLNEIPASFEQILKPQQFDIRTQPAPGNRERGSRNYGRGAVLLFITMQGEDNGSIPDDDRQLPYLIPDGHSATLLLGHDFLVRRVFIAGCRAMAHLLDHFEYTTIPDNKGFTRYVWVFRGRLREGRIYGWSPDFQMMLIEDLILPIGDSDKCSLILRVDPDSLTWSLYGNTPLAVSVKPNSGPSYTGNVHTSWGMSRVFNFVVDPGTGKLNLAHVAPPVSSFTVEPGDFANYPPIASRFKEIGDFVKHYGEWAIANGEQAFARTAASIDVFRFNSLLFKGRNSVLLKSSHVPGDMLMVGDVGPDLSNFVIDQLEPLIGTDSKMEFSVTPPRIGIHWSLEHLPGGSGDLGNISQSGIYNSPKDGAIKGNSLRLRVRARLGQYTSTALLTVLARDISINPVVQICGARERRELSAGSWTTGVLEWSVVDSGSGATVVPSSDPEGDHTYIAGAANPSKAFLVDEIQVRNLRTGHRSSAWVVVTSGIPSLEVRYEADSQPERVRCKAYFAGHSEPIDGLALEWKLLAGSGRIDSDGLFSLDPEPSHRFAVVTCTVPAPPPFPAYQGFCILPLPLVPLPELLKALDDATTLLSTPFSGDSPRKGA